MDTKKVHDLGFGAFSRSFLINNGNDDKSEIQEMSKIIFNEIQRRILLLNYPLYRVQFISYFTLFFSQRPSPFHHLSHLRHLIRK